MSKQKKSTLLSWFTERYPLDGLSAAARRKTVPRHRHSCWYFLGGILLFFFVLQMMTGIMLMIYYRPTTAEAHISIVRIISEIPFGWLIRSAHIWGAHFMVVVLLAHFFSTFLLQSYRKPRELTWATGMLLLVLTLTLAFSGYLLPWDELAFTATRVGTDVPRALGSIGNLATVFLRGGDDVTGDTLGRFYAFHVCLLPLLLFLTATIHISLVQVQGMSRPQEKPAGEDELPFFPNFIYRDMALWMLAFAVLVTVASLLPPGIGAVADPLGPTPAGLKPEWFFLFLFQTIKAFPSRILIVSGESVAALLVFLAALFFLAVPFLDRRSQRQEKSPVFIFIGWATLIYFLAMTLWGFLS